jgi:hypothetical protein
MHSGDGASEEVRRFEGGAQRSGTVPYVKQAAVDGTSSP